MLKNALRMTFVCMLGKRLDPPIVHAESPGHVDLQNHSSNDLSQQLRGMKGSPRFTLMLALRQNAIDAPFDGASVSNSETFEWIARDSSKPGRPFLQWLKHPCVCSSFNRQCCEQACGLSRAHRLVLLHWTGHLDSWNAMQREAVYAEAG